MSENNICIFSLYSVLLKQTVTFPMSEVVNHISDLFLMNFMMLVTFLLKFFSCGFACLRFKNADVKFVTIFCLIADCLDGDTCSFFITL